MNHARGLFPRPDREMHVTSNESESVLYHYTHHILLMAVISVVCAFIDTAQISRNFDDSNILELSLLTGLVVAILFCGATLAGVVVMGRIIWRMVRNYPRRPSLAHCMVFAGYVATPLSLSGLVALYLLARLCALVGAIVLFYTSCLLYLGIPTFLNISEEEGLSFFNLMLAIGVLVLGVLLAIMVILWGYGYRLL